jgi:Peptidase family S41/N-terminal domain of Peptidase_S41 in eukaryotic IRBP
VERAEQDQIERAINHELKGRFAEGTVQRAVLLQHGDDPAIEPGQLMVRVFIPASGGSEDYEQVLAAWQDANRARMEQIRRELSLRLPSARLLEFTFDNADPATPRITMPDDGSLADEQMSGRQIVTTALSLLRANYVYPEQAEQAAAAVEIRLEAGEYDDLDEVTLTELVTSHLQDVTGDKHLRMRVGGGPPPRRERVSEPAEPAEREDHEMRRLTMRRRGRLDNFGIRRVERLDGNIGCLDLRRMAVPANAGPAIAAAMELVAGTYALIIDMRRNGGGSPEGVALWCSYLLEERPTHLNDIFHADTGETRQFWALPYVPGTRYIDRPVYVLTGRHTFSGGEELCYNLQALGRAELIGETTGGGAHPTRGFPISRAVHIGIPFARSINPVTGTNWQGTGVVPDVAVPEAQAYDVAYAKALGHVVALDGVPPPIADEARDALAGLAPPPSGTPPAADQG